MDLVQRQTRLYPWHVSKGGNMIDFANWLLPLSYASLSSKASVLHTRQKCSFFDVSHMKVVDVIGPKRVEFLDNVLPTDIRGQRSNTLKLSVITNAQGGIEDDIIVIRSAPGESLRIVCNAANAEKDFGIFTTLLQKDTKEIRRGTELVGGQELSIIAVQGPLSEVCLQKTLDEWLGPMAVDLGAIPSMGSVNILPKKSMLVTISRSGYTGLDGFEVIVGDENVFEFVELLASHKDVQPAGLACRDMLRIEAGYCLYGHELTPEITPGMARLSWLLSKDKLRNSSRGQLVGGKRVLLEQLLDPKKIEKVRVGLKSVSRGLTPKVGSKVGTSGLVTSSCLSPTLQLPICMAYLPRNQARVSSEVKIRLGESSREKDFRVTKLPFIAQSSSHRKT